LRATKDARDSAFLLCYCHDQARYRSVAAFSAQQVVDAIEACELRRETDGALALGPAGTGGAHVFGSAGEGAESRAWAGLNYSIFRITVDRNHSLKWLFPQEKATFDELQEATPIRKMP